MNKQELKALNEKVKQGESLEKIIELLNDTISNFKHGLELNNYLQSMQIKIKFVDDVTNKNLNYIYTDIDYVFNKLKEEEKKILAQDINTFIVNKLKILKEMYQYKFDNL